MVILDVPLEFSGKTATIMYGSCWHLGNPSVHLGGVRKFMEEAKVKPWWHVGDMVESILPGDKRFSVAEHKDATLPTVKKASNYIKSAKEKCLGLIIGNHEWKLTAMLGDVSEDIANRADVKYLGGVVVFRFVCPDGECLVFSAHGRGSMGFNSGFPERDALNREIKLRRILDRFPGDVKCVGHYHRTIVAPPIDVARGTIVGERMKRRATPHKAEWCIAAPSMFLNYDIGTSVSYAEIALMPPTDLGWMEIVIERDGLPVAVREKNENGTTVNERRRECVG